MNESSPSFAPFLVPGLCFALGIVWLVCALGGASQWLYPVSISMTMLGTAGLQAALVARSHERRIRALEARLAGLSRGPG